MPNKKARPCLEDVSTRQADGNFILAAAVCAAPELTFIHLIGPSALNLFHYTPCMSSPGPSTLSHSTFKCGLIGLLDHSVFLKSFLFKMYAKFSFRRVVVGKIAKLLVTNLST
jgi:hypothetical protein